MGALPHASAKDRGELACAYDEQRKRGPALRFADGVLWFDRSFKARLSLSTTALVHSRLLLLLLLLLLLPSAQAASRDLFLLPKGGKRNKTQQVRLPRNARRVCHFYFAKTPL